MMPAAWLPLVMEASFNEIYVMDGDSWHLLHVNEAACQNLQYVSAELTGKSLTDIVAPDSFPSLHNILQSLAAQNSASPSPQYLSAIADFVRRDGSRYSVALRLFLAHPASTPIYICIAIAQETAIRQEALNDGAISKSLFRALVSNTPGLVYQFQLTTNDKASFTYLSEGCLALLGLSVEQLRESPELFIDLILPADRPSYLKSMADSANELKSWNWEGRIWVDAWKDIKWINLRATPQKIAPDGVRWSGIMTNITQSKLEQFEIKRSRARLAELSAHIEHVKELERTQLSRDVHDDLGGNLTAIKMALALLASRLPQSDIFLNEKAQYLDSLVDRTIESAHRIASDLRPGILDLGIVAAIEWQAREFEKQIGVPCKFSTSIKEIDLPTDQATAIFRIFQEALTNIAKHANAKRVDVKLSLSRGNLRLKIIDNGKGIEPVERLKPQSFGIRGMTERAHSLGGNVTISPTEGGGSTVTITIPQK